MIDVKPFKAKLVRDPEQRETNRGAPVCSMRAYQINPGKPSVFIDIAVFGEDLVTRCMELSKGSLVEVADAGLVYREWVAKPQRKGGKPQKRYQHSLIAREVVVVEE